MTELARQNPIESGKQKETFEIKELKLLPESVQTLFQKLPDSIKTKIFPKQTTTYSEIPSEGRKRSLEEIAASFDESTREKFLNRCLNELFFQGKFTDRLDSVSPENLQQEVTRLLNVMWQNRTKGDEVQLFNQEYYDNFLKDREILAGKVAEKKLEVEKAEASLEATSKQKRLSQRKQEEVVKLRKQLKQTIEELMEFDFQNNNTSLDFARSNDISARREKELEWTKGTTVIIRYLDPAEFATAMGEKLDSWYSRENLIVANPERVWFGRVLDEETIDQARRKIDAIKNAVNEWDKTHDGEESFKKRVEVKAEERQTKLIEYLQSLIESYIRGNKSNRSDEEMIYTIRQMEVSLYILGK